MRVLPRRPHSLVVLLAVALALCVGHADVAFAGACSARDARASEASPRAIERATLCLVNRERADRGLRRLHRDRRLRRAGHRHVRAMIGHNFFAHDSRSGAKFSTRIRRAGYMRSARRWIVGENLAWGSGPSATARSIVNAWMNSPGHRANILHRRFREIGIAVRRGAPVAGVGESLTYATEFGSRR